MNGLASLDSRPGTYVLRLESTSSRPIQVGKLGVLNLRPGCYLYVGSAFGPGGVCARVGHHARLSKRPHWHIDYVRRVTKLAAVWYTYDTMQREHVWANVLTEFPQTSVPLPGFGASDCTCISHLVYTATALELKAFQDKLLLHITDHASVYHKVFT